MFYELPNNKPSLSDAHPALKPTPGTCNTGLFCVGDNTEPTKDTCASSMPCNSSAANGGCYLGDFCNPKSQSCAHCPKNQKPAFCPCQADTECDQSKGSQVCDPNASYCVPRPKPPTPKPQPPSPGTEGGSCNALSCGTKPQPKDCPCTFPLDCASWHCINGKCED